MKRLTNVLILVLFSFVQFNGYCAPMMPVGYMPQPGTLTLATPAYDTPLPLGVEFDVKNPLKFTFLMEKGTDAFSQALLQSEGRQAIRYFLAALALPAKDMWVNLSPYEKNRIAPEALAKTDLGADLLGEDYVLKQLAASLTHPDTAAGKKYWESINGVGANLCVRPGQTRRSAPTDLFTKVWIVPGEMLIKENGARAVIDKATLKVKVDQNDPVFQKNIIPLIEKEVNEGKNFARLRQIYRAVMLAGWYRNKLRGSFLDSVYFDKKQIKGVDYSDPQIREKVYQSYLEAFQKGAYNIVKKDGDCPRMGTVPISGRITRRTYFSGGANITTAALGAPVIQSHDPVPAGSAVIEVETNLLAQAQLQLPNGAKAIDSSLTDEQAMSLGFKIKERAAELSRQLDDGRQDTDLVDISFTATVVRSDEILQAACSGGVVKGTYGETIECEVSQGILFVRFNTKEHGTLTEVFILDNVGKAVSIGPSQSAPKALAAFAAKAQQASTAVSDELMRRAEQTSRDFDATLTSVTQRLSEISAGMPQPSRPRGFVDGKYEFKDESDLAAAVTTAVLTSWKIDSRRKSDYRGFVQTAIAQGSNFFIVGEYKVTLTVTGKTAQLDIVKMERGQFQSTLNLPVSSAATGRRVELTPNMMHRRPGQQYAPIDVVPMVTLKINKNLSEEDARTLAKQIHDKIGLLRQQPKYRSDNPVSDMNYLYGMPFDLLAKEILATARGEKLKPGDDGKYPISYKILSDGQLEVSLRTRKQGTVVEKFALKKRADEIKTIVPAEETRVVEPPRPVLVPSQVKVIPAIDDLSSADMLGMSREAKEAMVATLPAPVVSAPVAPAIDAAPAALAVVQEPVAQTKAPEYKRVEVIAQEANSLTLQLIMFLEASKLRRRDDKKQDDVFLKRHVMEVLSWEVAAGKEAAWMTSTAQGMRKIVIKRIPGGVNVSVYVWGPGNDGALVKGDDLVFDMQAYLGRKPSFGDMLPSDKEFLDRQIGEYFAWIKSNARIVSSVTETSADDILDSHLKLFWSGFKPAVNQLSRLRYQLKNLTGFQGKIFFVDTMDKRALWYSKDGTRVAAAHSSVKNNSIYVSWRAVAEKDFNATLHKALKVVRYELDYFKGVANPALSQEDQAWLSAKAASDRGMVDAGTITPYGGVDLSTALGTASAVSKMSGALLDLSAAAGISFIITGISWYGLYQKKNCSPNKDSI